MNKTKGYFKFQMENYAYVSKIIYVSMYFFDFRQCGVNELYLDSALHELKGVQRWV